MKNYFSVIQSHLQRELAISARDYLKVGMKLFHDQSGIGIQASIGNLAIAIELMLKAFIVKYNPGLLFKDLPLELRVLFACPGEKIKSFYWRRYDIDLRSFGYKTIELDECISIFYILLPDHKQLLQPYFRFLANCRNKSVHASIPSFQNYDMDRTAYLALNIHKILVDAKVFGYFPYILSEKDKAFLTSFDAGRAERVSKKIEEAKKQSKELKHELSIINAEGWNCYATGCPICGSEGILGGYTDMWTSGDMRNLDYGLDFYADSFECFECGLVLDDVKELELVGMKTTYDRSRDMDKWNEEHMPDINEI